MDVSSDPKFEQFVSAELPRLLGLASALTGNRHDAWDLVQEALTRVGLKWKKVSSGNPAGYARTTLIRLNIDRVRRFRREHPVSELPEGVLDSEAAWPPEPWLANALRELSPRQRTVIGLRFVMDMDLNGIAHELGCSTGTVKAHLYRGLESLRDAQRRPHPRADVTEERGRTP